MRIAGVELPKDLRLGGVPKRREMGFFSWLAGAGWHDGKALILSHSGYLGSLEPFIQAVMHT